MPRKLPNSSEFTPSRSPWYRVTNKNPHANANACTVPTTADSSLYPRVCPWARGTIAMTSAPATQNPKYPHAAAIPIRIAPAAPGKAISARV